MNSIKDYENYIYENYNKLPNYFIPCFYVKNIFHERIGISARCYNGKIEIIKKKMGFFEAYKFKKLLKKY